MEWYQKRTNKLLKKYLSGRADEAEQKELEGLLMLSDKEALYRFVEDANGQKETQEVDTATNLDIKAILARGEKRRTRTHMQMAAAAIVGILVLLTAGLWVTKKTDNPLEERNGTIGSCSPALFNPELDRRYFACDIEIKDLFQKKLDNKGLGTVVRFNNIEFLQKKPGVLQVVDHTDRRTTRSGERYLTLHTPPRRQFTLSLPDGTTIRLDGGSTLHYLLNPVDTSMVYCRLEGQAFVKVPEKPQGKPFVLENYNSQLFTLGAEYAVRSEIGYTRAVRLEGEVSLATMEKPKAVPLEETCNTMEVYSLREGKEQVRDSFALTSLDRATALNWTKSVRRYNNMSLRVFMLEMERWYGFRIESMRCLPKDRRITTSVCQEASLEEVFVSVEKSGVAIYHRDGMFTFCPPAGRLDKTRWDNIASIMQKTAKSSFGFRGFW